VTVVGAIHTTEPATPPVEADVDGLEEVYRCPRCDRPFRRERQRDLHLGEAHGDLDDKQREAYEAAAEAEADDLFFFHIKIVVALGVLYSSTVLLYTAIVGLTG
jgi:uncharacterized C2H2 Zn-finger protein